MRAKLKKTLDLPSVDQPSGQEALERLLSGNRRYVESKQIHPDQSTRRRIELREGQHPFAVILGCADSRVPPAVIFDQGLGDLFTIRVAGNVLDDLILGSMEYAELHLDTPLIVVLGHSRCGAVEATAKGGAVEGHLPSLTRAIQPALDAVKDQPGDPIDNAVRVNALMVAEQIRRSGVHFNERVRSGELMIVAAYYDLETGVVEVL
jgi:carbonic anhydrase